MQENPRQSLDAIRVGTHPVPAAEVVEPKPRYWGLWATIGFSLLVAVAYVVANLVVIGVFTIAKRLLDPAFDPMSMDDMLAHNGLLLAVTLMTSSCVVIGLVLLLIHFCRGTSAKQYLALHRVSYRTLTFWLAVTALGLVCVNVLKYLTGQDVVSHYVTDAWQTLDWLPLLCFVGIIVGPLSEEVFYRGFLFAGLRHSPLGNLGAVLVTSAAWAAAHQQYDLFEMGFIFAGGILLGIARIRSESLYVPLAMHTLGNLVAIVEVAWFCELSR